MGCGANDGKPKNNPLRINKDLETEFKRGKNIEVKLVLLGDSGVGKSSIATRYTKDIFKEDYDITIGGSYFKTEVITSDNICVKLHIWDTGGAERFRSMAHIYYKDATAAILVFDVTSQESLDNIKFWLTDLSQYENPKNITFGLAGNKSDKNPESQYIIPKAKKYAEEKGMVFQQTSALTGVGIKELFKEIAEKAVKKSKKQEKVNINTVS